MAHQLPFSLYHCQDKGFFYKMYSKYVSASPLVLFKSQENFICVCGNEVVTPL